MERYVVTVMDRAECKKHNVPAGIPCWHLHPSTPGEGRLAAICGRRAKRAGFVGTPSAQSLRTIGKKRR